MFDGDTVAVPVCWLKHKLKQFSIEHFSVAPGGGTTVSQRMVEMSRARNKLFLEH
ncbi:unnamed protein product [Linum tenue]|uniref:Uncharacterized protein n=1 Tax=Linum tenue TaxID=586396 RepID=A0AAV0HRC6_9ROSI|nr:unnamed protein product [Linum tenue]